MKLLFNKNKECIENLMYLKKLLKMFSHMENNDD